MNNLESILQSLALKGLQVRITTGYKDAINTYGWHIIYCLSVYETVQFCIKCRNKHGVDYKDDYILPHRHQHRHEERIIYCEHFFSLHEVNKKLEQLASEYEVHQPHEA
jgi:aspartate carbamoyltransferase regulatory subunit